MFLLFIVGIFLLGICPVTAINGANITDNSYNGTGRLIATYGDGKLYQYGSLNVVELHGNYREMGRQYGALRKDLLNDIYNQMTKNSALVFAAGNLTSREEDEKQIYAAYPNYNEIMLGISETSGLGDKTYLTCSMIQLFYILISDPSYGQCSFDAAWGPYTTNSELVVGRNFDLSHVMSNYSEIVVYNPDDGSIPVANIGYVGSVYMTSGLNREGLFLSKNDGDESYGELKSLNKTSNNTESSKNIDTYLELFQLTQKSANITQLDENFANANTTIGSIINVADNTGSFSYEWIQGKYVKRAPQDKGLLVATNNFVDPSWGLKIPFPGNSNDVGQSILRMDNVLIMSMKNKGNITPEFMMQMMSTPVSDGGPFFPTYTTSQMVVVPHDLKIWFEVPRHYNWTEVDLKNHFDA